MTSLSRTTIRQVEACDSPVKQIFVGIDLRPVGDCRGDIRLTCPVDHCLCVDQIERNLMMHLTMVFSAVLRLDFICKIISDYTVSKPVEQLYGDLLGRDLDRIVFDYARPTLPPTNAGYHLIRRNERTTAWSLVGCTGPVGPQGIPGAL
jgi:hypothetical protein